MSQSVAEATTERIRAAALTLFAQRGYGNTTIEHISTMADVGVATIYRRWPDKAAIANELYAASLDSMLAILDGPAFDDERTEFVATWRQMWEWASSNQELFVFLNASAGAPWLTDDNVARKADVGARELAAYARLRIDAAPELAAAMIGGMIGALLGSAVEVDHNEVADRLWRALTSP